MNDDDDDDEDEEDNNNVLFFWKGFLQVYCLIRGCMEVIR